MKEIKNAVLKDGWCVCVKCGHKLGRVVGDKPPIGLEIKCHSCKAINLVNKPKKQAVKKKKQVRQYTTPHCKHCAKYKEFTGTCIVKLMSFGFGARAKAQSSRSCQSFEPLEEYKENYKEMKKNGKSI